MLRDRLKQLLLPCFSFRFTNYSTSNAMSSAWSALTSSAATEHGTGPLLQSTAGANIICSRPCTVQSWLKLISCQVVAQDNFRHFNLPCPAPATCVQTQALLQSMLSACLPLSPRQACHLASTSSSSTPMPRCSVMSLEIQILKRISYSWR